MKLHKCFIILGAVLCSLHGLAQVPSYVPSTGLIAFWPLDNNQLNVAGTQHHGTHGNAVGSMDRRGHQNAAMYLNGTNAFITLPASAMQQVTAAFTISIWARSDTFVPSANGHEIINDRIPSSWPYRFRIGYAYANNSTFHVDSCYFDRIATNGVIEKAATPAPSFDGWEHYVFVYDVPTAATATINAYRNGVFVSQTLAPNAVSGGRAINVGRTFFPSGPTTGAGYFKGSVDEIGLWNRALTPTEITALFNGCTLSILAQPTNQVVPAGGSASFSVIPTNASATIQWQIDSTGGNWLPLMNSTNISGANSTILTLNNLDRSWNGVNIRAFISDSACNGSSQSANLSVTCGALVTQSPASIAQLQGTNAVFNAASSQSGALYQWQIDLGSGFQNIQSFGQFTGTNTPTLTVSNIQRSNNGYRFRCLISSLGCTDTTLAAVLTVNCDALLTQQPQNVNGTVGGTASFSLNNIPGATYAWYRNTGFSFVAITNGGQFSGANSATLQISNLSLLNNNTAFIGVVNEADCSDTSDIALLYVSNNTSTADLNSHAWQTYPNPAQQYLMLDISELNKTKEVRITDLSGKLCFEQRLEPGIHELPLTHLANGMYIIAVGEQYRRFVVLQP